MTEREELTEGQRDALAELRLIEAQDGGLEIETARAKEGRLVVDVSLDCRSLRQEQSSPEGLDIHECEFVRIHVPSMYPLRPPFMTVTHNRFAGFENVMRRGAICVFRSPETEWNPSDGMAIFVRDRVWGWLQRAVRGDVERQDGAYHAPLLHEHGRVPFSVRYDADSPQTNELWHGYVTLRRKGSMDYDESRPSPVRLSLSGWPGTGRSRRSDEFFGAAILLPERVGFYMPKSLKSLLGTIEQAGLKAKQAVEFLGDVARSEKRSLPVFLIVGVPRSRSQAHPHHLTTLMLGEKMTELLWGAGGTVNKDEAVSIALRRAGEFEPKALLHREARPALVQRRDDSSPMAWARGKTVSLWGTGAVGAPMALQFARAGVDRLILRDKGRVHSGLLVRQPYGVEDEEALKVDALRHQLKQVRPDLAVDVESNDIRGSFAEMEEWEGSVDLVVNTTASVSGRAVLDLMRHGREETEDTSVLTVGIDHRGERAFARLLPPKAVVSNEELEREVQREVAADDALHGYADAFFPAEEADRGDPFFPEPGCSQATFVGSFADMSALTGASLNWAMSKLSSIHEGAAYALMTAQPHIAVAAGEPSTHEVCVLGRAAEHEDERNGYRVRYSSSALQSMRQYIDDAAQKNGEDMETGGPLWGGCDEVRGVIWVDEAGPAPSDSVETTDRFRCGTEGLAEKEEQLRGTSRGATGFIGTWHTHPEAPPTPSDIDHESMEAVCTRPEPTPRRFLMTIVGRPHDEPELRPHVFLRDEYLPGAQ